MTGTTSKAGRPRNWGESTKPLQVRLPERIWSWYRKLNPKAVQAILIAKYREINRRGNSDESV